MYFNLLKQIAMGEGEQSPGRHKIDHYHTEKSITSRKHY
jgi:hypothetical protein